MRIDLNADLGEEAGHDDDLLALVSSANIACGAHAGDAGIMQRTIVAAHEQHVAVGAHPSFADRENFGRKELRCSPEEIYALVAGQVRAFAGLAEAAGVSVNHVKPHGALYNMAARDQTTAGAVARAIADVDPRLILFAPPSSELARAGRARGLRVACEVFADRNYLASGALVPRTSPDALLRDPAEGAARVLRILREGVVRAVDGTEVALAADTICIHGDTPAAVKFAAQLRTALTQLGVTIAPPVSREL